MLILGAAWEAVKVVDRSEETEEDGTIIQRERERFTNELTLVRVGRNCDPSIAGPMATPW